MTATLSYMRINFETSDLYHRTFAIAAAHKGFSLKRLFEHFADTHLAEFKKDAAKALGIDPDSPPKPAPRKRKPKE